MLHYHYYLVFMYRNEIQSYSKLLYSYLTDMENVQIIAVPKSQGLINGKLAEYYQETIMNYRSSDFNIHTYYLTRDKKLTIEGLRWNNTSIEEVLNKLVMLLECKQEHLIWKDGKRLKSSSMD